MDCVRGVFFLGARGGEMGRVGVIWVLEVEDGICGAFGARGGFVSFCGECGCLVLRSGRGEQCERGELTGARGWLGRGFKHNLYKGRVYGLNIDFLAIV